jgi:hypothetical protein
MRGEEVFYPGYWRAHDSTIRRITLDEIENRIGSKGTVGTRENQ